MKRIRIVHGSAPFSGRVSDADTGQTVDRVTGAEIDLRVGHAPAARLEVFVAEVDVAVDIEHVRWHGLDHVPVEALRAELARREVRERPLRLHKTCPHRGGTRRRHRR